MIEPARQKPGSTSMALSALHEAQFRTKEGTEMNPVTETNTKANPAPRTGIVRAMTDAMTSDDVESMVNLFAPDGEWLIVATGERFRGLDEIRQLAIRSVAGRGHPAGTGIKPTNVFLSREVHRL
jgi:hypothetical protein